MECAVLGGLHVKETLIGNMLALEKLVLVSFRPGLTWESVGNGTVSYFTCIAPIKLRPEE